MCRIFWMLTNSFFEHTFDVSDQYDPSFLVARSSASPHVSATHRLTMLRTVALIALVARASAYQTDVDSCTTVYNYFKCASFNGDNVTCAATDVCVFESDAFGNACSIQTDAFALLSADYTKAGEVLTQNGNDCGSYEESDCGRLRGCVWNELDSGCGVSKDGADYTLGFYGFPAGMIGFNELIIHGRSVCSVAVADCPTILCNVDEDYQDSGVAKCVPSLQYAVQAVQSKCGTVGLAALGRLATTVGTEGADQADEDSCTNAYDYFSCSLFSANATACAANDMCVYDALGDWSGNACSLGVDTMALLSADFVEASTVLADARETCEAVTTEAACTANCAWDSQGEGCILSAAAADALLYAADTPNGIRGLNDVVMVGGSTCSVAIADCPAVICEVDTDFQQTNTSMCVPSLVYAASTVQTKCGASGAAALATLQVNAGIASGASMLCSQIAAVVASLVAAAAMFA